MQGIPSSEALQAMLSASQTGSLSAAAEELGITHGAVSRRIQGLEAWLGQPIFERHGRGVLLTPAGEIFARRVERSLDAIASVAADLRSTTQRRPVKLSVLPSFARLWIMPRLDQLRGPDHDLSIVLNCEHRMAAVDGRDADVAVRVGSGGWPGVDARLLFEETAYPVASAAVAERLAGAKPEDILQQPLIHDADAGGWRRWCRAAGVTYRARNGEMKFDDFDLALAAAANGFGIALAQDPLSRDLERSGALVRVPGHQVTVRNGHYVITRMGEVRAAVLRLADRLIQLGHVHAADQFGGG